MPVVVAGSGVVVGETWLPLSPRDDSSDPMLIGAWLFAPICVVGCVTTGVAWLPPRPRDDSNDPRLMEA